MISTDHNVPELKGAAEFEDHDFQIVLQTLLKAYRPRLEQDLRWTESAEALQKEAKDNLPDCEEEIALADQLLARYQAELGKQALPSETWEREKKHFSVRYG